MTVPQSDGQEDELFRSLIFTFAEYDPIAQQIAPQRTFVSWSYFEYELGRDTLELSTDRGVQLGSTIDEVAAAYPDADRYDDYVYAAEVFDGFFGQSGQLVQMFAGTDLCTA